MSSGRAKAHGHLLALIKREYDAALDKAEETKPPPVEKSPARAVSPPTAEDTWGAAEHAAVRRPSRSRTGHRILL